MLAPILIGFAMATLGVALLFLGEVPFLSGKRIPAGRARLIGLVLVGYLPLALGVRQLINVYLGHDAVDGLVLTWGLLGLCVVAVMVLLFRIVVPKKPRRKTPASLDAGMKAPSFVASEEVEEIAASEPIEEAEEWPKPESAKKPPGKKSAPGAAKKPASQKPPKTAASEENPFDFG